MNTEFYTRPDGEVEVCEQGKPAFQLNEMERDFIVQMILKIREEYPEAYKALCECYKDNLHNRFYYEFLIVRRFIKCNWSQFDNVADMDDEGNLHFEFTYCPMRGECKYFKIICEPKYNVQISASEMNVLRLIVKEFTDEEIADTLHISIYTVQNHRKNMMRKLKLNHSAQLVNYWHKNNLK
jgi:DNA-binding CsgD family transcriptional regulator